MTETEREEYRALRATIQTRGTARVLVFAIGYVTWAALALTTAALVPIPAATFFPLLALAGTFEAVFSLHVGAERIGRYLQVFHQDRWELTSMAFGAPLSGTGADPLFSVLFGVAAVSNFIPVVLDRGVFVEVATIGAAHAAFLARIAVAHRAARRQRTADLERFKRLETDA